MYVGERTNDTPNSDQGEKATVIGCHNPPYVPEQLIIADRCRLESGSTIRQIPNRAEQGRLLVPAIRPTNWINSKNQ